MAVLYYDTNGGGMSNIELDLNFRTTNWINGAQGTASGTMTLPSSGSGANYFVIAGSTTITGITDVVNGDTGVYGYMCRLKFSGTPQLTHGAGFLLAFGANMQMAAGDVATFVNESSGVWRLVSYLPASSWDAVTVGTLDTTSIASGTIGNSVVASTAAAGDNSTRVATTAYVDTAAGTNAALMKAKNADEIQNSGTNPAATLTADADLTWTNVATGKYRMELYLNVLENSSCGFSWNFDTTNIAGNYGWTNVDSTTITAGKSDVLGVDKSLDITSGITANRCHIIGSIEVTNATNEITLRWAQENISAANLTLYEGSWMMLTQENS